MHRLAEALNNLGRDARIIQKNAAFHPGWFSSDVNTISYSEFRSNTDLSPNRDVVILPETFLPALPRYAPGIPKILFNQMGRTALESKTVMVSPNQMRFLVFIPT